MAPYLVVDNTDYHNYLGNLLKAVYAATTGEPLTPVMRDLILNVDVATIEQDLSRAAALRL